MVFRKNVSFYIVKNIFIIIYIRLVIITFLNFDLFGNLINGDELFFDFFLNFNIICF